MARRKSTGLTGGARGNGSSEDDVDEDEQKTPEQLLAEWRRCCSVSRMYVALNEQGVDLFSLARDLVEITRTFCGDLPAARLEDLLEPVSKRRKPKPRKKSRRKKTKLRHNQQEIYQVVMSAVQLLGAPGERVACSLLRSDFPIPPDRFPGYLVGRTKDVFAKSKRMTRPDKYHGPLID